MSRWIDPVKNCPAKDSTLNMLGNFREFTALMRKMLANFSGRSANLSSV
jgi:hypothetical protein